MKTATGSTAEMVNPARAGMILPFLLSQYCFARKPRASGDDPPVDFLVGGTPW